MGQLAKLIVAQRESLVLSDRPSISTAGSLLGSTLIAMQPTLGAALPISMQHFAGTGIGAAVGAVTATCFRGSLWAFGIALFLIGLLCATLHVERTAYRYASITLAIVMLAMRSTSGGLIAIHWFFEVSLGIAVGLGLSALWPERRAD